MKNKIIILLAFTLFSATGALAANPTDIIGGTSIAIGNGTFTPSNKVGIKIWSSASSYAASSAHLNGTFEYGTVGGTGVTGDPSKILKKAHTTSSAESTAGYGIPTAPASATALGSGFAD